MAPRTQPVAPGVSIQLVSPTSGDIDFYIPDYKIYIEFPFNWFPQRVGTEKMISEALEGVSRFPFNWFPQRVGTPLDQDVTRDICTRFHSIGFPNEWGRSQLSSGAADPA